MNFTTKQVEKLLKGELTQMRVLKKEGEHKDLVYDTKEKKYLINPVIWKNRKRKYQPNKPYAVKVKGKAVKVCTKCGLGEANAGFCEHCHCDDDYWKPLRFKFKSIRQKNDTWVLDGIEVMRWEEKE